MNLLRPLVHNITRGGSSMNRCRAVMDRQMAALCKTRSITKYPWPLSVSWLSSLSQQHETRTRASEWLLSLMMRTWGQSNGMEKVVFSRSGNTKDGINADSYAGRVGDACTIHRHLYALSISICKWIELHLPQLSYLSQKDWYQWIQLGN